MTTSLSGPPASAVLGRRRRRQAAIRRVLFWIIVLIMGMWSIGPFLWQLLASVQPDVNLLRTTPSFIPVPFTLEHYGNVFGPRAFWHFLLNSVIVAVLATAITQVLGVIAAYSLARLHMVGKGIVLALLLGMSMFPQIAIVAPLYALFSNWSLLDTYAGLVAPYIGLTVPLTVFILYTHLRTIPRQIDEAAKVDGAGRLRTLWSVILPLAVPGLVTAGIIGFIGNWNELMLALAFTSDPTHQTISVGIANFADADYAPLGDMAAASIVATIPLVILVIVFQRRIVSGLTSGGVKE